LTSLGWRPNFVGVPVRMARHESTSC
jgi:hypothetical protein